MPQKHWDEVVATRLGGFAHVTAAVVRGMVGRRAAGSSRPVPRRDRLAWAAKAGLVRGRCSRASSAATGSGHRRLDNALLWLEEPGRAQRLADRFATLPLPAVLDGLARRVNPLLRDLLQGYRYYWATHTAEYATDVLFTSRTALHALYARLLRHATLCLRAEDVLTFLGRKLHGRFAGELLNDCRRRWPGARVKHWMKASWSTMYDKHGCVLRVETVIYEPYEFNVRRRGRRTLGWHPLPKGVAYLPRYAAVSAAANQRYLDALAVVDDPAPAHPALERVVQPVRDPHGRSSRAFNSAAAADLALFTAVLRGEHTLQGFRNREVRTHLFGPTAATDRRRSAQVSRLVKRPHLRGLVAKVPARAAGGLRNGGTPS